MKKLFISKQFILMLLFIVFLVFFEIPTSSAAELTQSEIVDKISETSGKIMKYNVITNETTEVNVEELKQKLKKDMGDTGYYRLKSHTPNLEPISLRVPFLLYFHLMLMVLIEYMILHNFHTNLCAKLQVKILILNMILVPLPQ